MGGRREGRRLKELIVTAKNQPGEMNKVADTLGKHGVNMLAVCAYNVNNEGRIHFVVNDHTKGKKVLKDHLKYKVTEGDVLVLELKHSPGELSRVTGILANSGINIELLYGSGSTYPSAQLVMAVSNLKKAEKVLGLE